MSAVVDQAAMSSTTTGEDPNKTKKSLGKGLMADGRRRSPVSIIAMVLLSILWTIPTLGLLVSSFRPREDLAQSGFWTAILNPFGTG